MISTKMPKILIAGSGITGSLVAASLLQQAKENVANQLQLSIWEKAKGTGGRMSTSRSPHNSSCVADLGAQYITCKPYYAQEHSKEYEELLSKGVLEPLKISINNCHEHEPGTKHYVAPNGMSSIAKYFISQSGCQPEFEHHISTITKEDNKWSVSTLQGKVELFDAIVLTIPVPQVLQLKGTVAEILENNQEMKTKLSTVEYSSRYAVGLYYDQGAELNLPFKASYLKDDPVFRYIAVDNLRRNRPELPTSVVFHTSVPFGLKHVELSIPEAEPILKEAIQRSFPGLPEPKAFKCQKWRYSQVTKSYEDQPGVLELAQEPPLLVGGDGFTHSNLDGCISSARKVVQHLVSKTAML
ncbi:renalase-like [Daphnia carinata]|uniref:renalase-like n=1 Tax=Daphnia carinata TaxID=120202 RepID=UPI002868C07D|nr:renalase-like [Daphnia carinata]